jgi:hypothetical protein
MADWLVLSEYEFGFYSIIHDSDSSSAMARLREIITDESQLSVLELFSPLCQQFHCEANGSVGTDIFVVLWASADISVSFAFRELDFRL